MTADPAWLAGLEEAMARHAVALSAARRGFAERLNAAPGASTAFPRAHLVLADPVADRLAREPALAVETWLRGELAARRQADAAAGNSTLGAHRADMRLDGRERPGCRRNTPAPASRRPCSSAWCWRTRR